jgi:hypothetical protein
MPSNPRAIAIYDVACQWSRNFKQRVKKSKSLNVPPNLQVIPAVGKWHLGAHVPDCFPKFSLNFIQGIGQVDGEILETLWSITNKVAGTTRAMAKSHRSEVLDDNMYDSNWKKWVGAGQSTFIMHGCFDTTNDQLWSKIVAALACKYKIAREALKVVELAFKDLTGAVGNPSWIKQWEQLEAEAMEKRGVALMIYNVAPIKGTVYVTR